MAKSFFEKLLSSFANTTVKTIQDAVKQRRNQEVEQVYSNLKNSTNLKYEVNNRTRILNDSVKLVEESNNIQTIINRKNIAIEHLDWFIKNKLLGVHINPPPEYSKEQLLLNFNENLYRQVETLVRKQIDKAKELKTKQGKQNALNKSVQLIQNNMNYFDKSVKNYQDVESSIRDLQSEIESILI
jgi:hypothetical protein